MTFRRVVVATDLSEPAAAAALRAARLRQTRTRYRVVHVMEPIGVGLVRRSPAATGVPYRADRERVARRAVEAFAETAGLPRAAAAVAVGKVAREIARAAADFEADLVVIGARGQTKLQRILLGSQARAVLRACGTSVLVARGEPRARADAAFERIAVLTDLHEPSAVAARRALALARESGAELLLVHAFDSSPFGSYLSVPAEVALPPPSSAAGSRELEAAIWSLMDAFNAEHLDGEARAVLVRGPPAQVIARVAQREKADLVVVGTHGRGRLGRALLGSVAEAAAERAPCSALVAREP